MITGEIDSEVQTGMTEINMEEITDPLENIHQEDHQTDTPRNIIGHPEDPLKEDGPLKGLQRDINLQKEENQCHQREQVENINHQRNNCHL